MVSPIEWTYLPRSMSERSTNGRASRSVIALLAGPSASLLPRAVIAEPSETGLTMSAGILSLDRWGSCSRAERFRSELGAEPLTALEAGTIPLIAELEYRGQAC